MQSECFLEGSETLKFVTLGCNCTVCLAALVNLYMQAEQMHSWFRKMGCKFERISDFVRV